jgi:predicted nucleotidyltransferase
MDVLDRAREFLERSPDVVAAYAFGSVPEGRAHRESDLDLAVLLDWDQCPTHEARGERQITLISELIGATHRNEIDLVVLNDAPPLLARHIIRNGRRLVAADAEAVHAFERDTQLRAADIEPFIQRSRARLLDALRT